MSPPRRPSNSLIHTMGFAMGLALIGFAFQSYRSGLPPLLCLILALVGLMLMAHATRVWKRARDEEAEEASRLATRDGVDARPIEPDVGVSASGIAIALMLLFTVVMQLHPITEWLLSLAPYHIQIAHRVCTRPLRPWDAVLVRQRASTLGPGAVVWMRTSAPLGPHFLGRVVAVGPEGYVDFRWTALDEPDRSRPRWGLATGSGDSLRVGADSLLVSFHGDAGGEPIFVELRARAEVEGVGIAVLAPPNRWRRLP